MSRKSKQCRKNKNKKSRRVHSNNFSPVHEYSVHTHLPTITSHTRETKLRRPLRVLLAPPASPPGVDAQVLAEPFSCAWVFSLHLLFPARAPKPDQKVCRGWAGNLMSYQPQVPEISEYRSRGKSGAGPHATILPSTRLKANRFLTFFCCFSHVVFFDVAV